MAGRPRKLSLDETLDRALQVFWTKGYDATSIGDISAAVGVGPSSLYNSFGSKSGLYLRAIERYRGQTSAQLMAPLDEHAHIVDGLVGVLRRAVVQYTDARCPRGCAVLAAGRVDDEATHDGLVAMREASVAYLTDRVAQAQDAQQLRPDASPEAIARFVIGSLQGLSSQARDGVDADALRGVVDLAAAALGAFRAEAG